MPSTSFFRTVASHCILFLTKNYRRIFFPINSFSNLLSAVEHINFLFSMSDAF